MTTLAIPTIHINGTAREALASDIDQACDALLRAVKACEATAPNARDYYPQGPNAHTLATAQHVERLRKLQSVRAELFEILEAIA